MDPIPFEKYAELMKGEVSRCMFCLSEAKGVSYEYGQSYDGQYHFIEMKCPECNATWTEAYTISGVMDITQPRMTATGILALRTKNEEEIYGLKWNREARESMAKFIKEREAEMAEEGRNG